MELTLVKIKDKETGEIVYHAVNDEHYDAMLAGSGGSLDDLFEWECVGNVYITEQILNEEGYYWEEKWK